MSLSDMNVYASHLSNGSWKGGDKMTITKQIKVGKKKKEKKKKRKKEKKKKQKNKELKKKLKKKFREKKIYTIW